MSDVQHWLYPINPKGAFVLRDENTGLETPVSPEALLAGIEENPFRPDPWILSRGYKMMRPGDAVWIYVAGQKIVCAVGHAVEVYYDEGAAGWYVLLAWDLDACRELAVEPITRDALGGVLVLTVLRAPAAAAPVLHD